MSSSPASGSSARVSPGQTHKNTLRRQGTAAHLYANFDRTAGGQNVTRDEARRAPRILRPGAIILPNLDIDEDTTTNPRARFTKDEVDARADDIVNAGDDHHDITHFKVAEPNPVRGNAIKITLRVDPADAERIRIWDVTNAVNAPRGGTVVIGPGVGNEHRIVDQTGSAVVLPNPGWEKSYYVEARTLAGDPATGEPAPASKAPPPPGRHRTPVPATTGGSQDSPTVNATNVGQSIYDTEVRYEDPARPNQRAVGDVWVELVQETGAGPSADLRDVGLFTIAPWIMTWNTLDCQRIYVAYLNWGGTMDSTAADIRYENHCMAWDLQQACHAAGLCPAPDADTTQPLTPNDPADIEQPNDEPFYVIDGADIDYDRWVQDEFEVGYCYAPHYWLHVALHNKRSGIGGGGLSIFVEEHMAHARLAVYNGIASLAGVAANAGSINFGGNLEVSPPVDATTPALPDNAAGPAVKAHRRAPFGKIILGDDSPRPCHPEFRQFLLAQKVQPVLPVDTSWLAVGHVDEFMSFVRANDRKKFRFLIANVRLMTILLDEVRKVDSAATMHAGKYEETAPRVWEYDEHFVADWWLRRGNPRDWVRSYSEKVEREKLAFLRERFKQGLALEEDDILSIPTYFKPSDNPAMPWGYDENQTIARNVGMVNMQVVNNHLMIPRPFGPRLEINKARTVVENTLRRWFGARKAPPVRLPPSNRHYFWARTGETVEQIARYFARPVPHDPARPSEPREQLIRKIENAGAPLRPAYQTAVTTLKNAILNHPENRNAPTPIATVAPGPQHEFTSWMRIAVPDNRVDVIEGYMMSILEPIGNRVHFIDDFECYHALMGEVHCGTNAKRKPPEEHAGFTARWWDPGVYDPDYDTSYAP